MWITVSCGTSNSQIFAIHIFVADKPGLMCILWFKMFPFQEQKKVELKVKL